VAVAAAILCPRAIERGDEGRAFLLSCAFITGLLAATIGTLYPVLLRSTVDPRYTIDAYNAASPRATLVLGLILLLPGMALAIGYFTYLYRSFRGKVTSQDQHY
jgi:cytochrome d ubiquinol oxidase subunit II